MPPELTDNPQRTCQRGVFDDNSKIQPFFFRNIYIIGKWTLLIYSVGQFIQS